MATDLLPRKTSKSAASLQRQFADLCARIHRIDLVAHLLVLTLLLVGYAFLISAFDGFAGNSTATAGSATRWTLGGVFAVLFGVALVQTLRCLIRKVNPYYVAREIEQTLPDAKNSLINWLDLHDDDIPSAFQKNLSGRAEEQMNEADADETIHPRKNWLLLGVLGVPTIGLLVFLVLGPSALAASLFRAFMPFYTPPVLARTQITLLQPEGGDAEVSPTRGIAFAARIDGRVPIHPKADAPTIHYRYQKSEEFATRPLQTDGDGVWTLQLQPTEIRTGFTYKISAGDAETPEHQVRVRAPAHVQKYEIVVHHRPYRRPATSASVFPNRDFAKPLIIGPVGSKVEMTVRANRPLQKASVEILTKGVKREVPIRMAPDDPLAFTSQWKLDQPGQFRVVFTTKDGEDNTDRDWHFIQVQTDEAPTVTLTRPGQDVTLPENGVLELEGIATSDVGLKSLTLHLQVLNDANRPKFLPLRYRPGKSFQNPDGTYPARIEYLDAVRLDELKIDKGTVHRLSAGNVIEYWLEAHDCTDAPHPEGRIGKSPVYKITLTKPADPQQVAAQQKAAAQRKENHQQQQDNQQAKKNQDPKRNGGGGQQPDPKEQMNAANQQKNDIQKKLDPTLKNEKDHQGVGGAKSADQPNADKKEGPQDGDKGATAKNKGPMGPDDAGANKSEGGGSGGQAKDSGEKKKDNPSKGERKDGPPDTGSGAKDAGPKGEPTGGVKDSGDKGMDTPMPSPAKNQASEPGAAQPTAKQGSKDDPKLDGPQQGNAKGIEQNGPEMPPNKDAQAGANSPPNAKSKGGEMTMGDPGNAKEGPEGGDRSGQARGNDAKTGRSEPTWAHFADLNDRLANADKNEDAANAAAKELKDIARMSADAGKSELAKDMLKKYGRDPKTGDKMKGPSALGTNGKGTGVSAEVNTAVANRAFAARIGQMQLDDWKKRVTPDLLKKAGLSDADWQRYLKTMQSYDALVRQLNAKDIRDAQRNALFGAGQNNPGARLINGTRTGTDALDAGNTLPPPELLDADRRFRSANP